MRHLSFLVGRGDGGGGHLNKKFPKIKMPSGLPGGEMLKLQFHWYIIFKVGNSDEAVGNTNCCKLFQRAQFDPKFH